MGKMRKILEQYKGATPAIRFCCERNGGLYFARFYSDNWEDHAILGLLMKEDAKKPFNEPGNAIEEPRQYQSLSKRAENIATKILEGPAMRLKDPYNTSTALPAREMLEVALPGLFKRLSYNPAFMPNDPAFRLAREMANSLVTRYFR